MPGPGPKSIYLLGYLSIYLSTYQSYHTLLEEG